MAKLILDEPISAFVRSAYVYPYYNADDYRNNGKKLSWTSDITTYSFADTNNHTQRVTQWINKKTLSIFNNLFFDMSPFYWLNAGQQFDVYEPGKVESFFRPEGWGEFIINYRQGRPTEDVKWTVRSLNIVVGLIGGYVALIWMVARFILDGYENFKFANSMVSQIYACTLDGPDAQAAKTKE